VSLSPGPCVPDSQPLCPWFPAPCPWSPVPVYKCEVLLCVQVRRSFVYKCDVSS